MTEEKTEKIMDEKTRDNLVILKNELASINEKKYVEKVNLDINNFRLANAVITISDKNTWDKEKLITYLTTHNYSFNVPKAFSGLSLKLIIDSIKVTCIFFKSGKCVIVGVKGLQVENLFNLIEKVREIIVNAECSPIKPNFTYKLSNRVYSFTLGPNSFRGTLCDWYNKIPEIRSNFEYNAVMFPGATLRIPHQSAVLLLFNSGKCILTGGKNKENYFQNVITYLSEIIDKIKERIDL
jgi:TATA-box binding protein (TBP) (component of TFIID and TFIIIB)